MNKRRAVVALGVVLLTSVLLVTTIYLTRKPTPFGTPIIERRVLINGTIIVDSNDAYYIEFSVPEEAAQIQIVGSFSTLDNNTIRVYVTTNGSLNPLSSNFSPSYDSGLVTSDIINLTLHSGGTYFLYYNNHNNLYDNSETPQKTLTTEVSLSYMLF